MDWNKHAWMNDVLRDMEIYAQRNGLTEAAPLIMTMRSALARLAELSDRPDGGIPRPWFAELVDELARICDRRGVVDARDRLIEARDAWGYHGAPRQSGDAVSKAHDAY
jgi:hypothetical protein